VKQQIKLQVLFNLEVNSEYKVSRRQLEDAVLEYMKAMDCQLNISANGIELARFTTVNVLVMN
jgi:hypothetical protein